MAQEHAVNLTINTGDAPVAIDVWSRYTVTLTMLGAGQPWSFVFWRSTVADTTWQALARQAKLLARDKASVQMRLTLGLPRAFQSKSMLWPIQY